MCARWLRAARRASLSDEAASFDDRLAIDLVERIVPRSMNRPDGLEVAALNVTVLKNGAALPPAPARSPP